MPIDWFTVGAQIVNFFVLVWILKRFLYQPVLKAMAARQKHIEESMSAAIHEKEEAARERASYEEQRRNIDHEREATLNEATRDAKAERSRLIEQAREEFQSLRQSWREILRREQDDLSGELARRVQQDALALAGQLVHDLADADLQERIAHKFIRKLEDLPPGERKSLTVPLDNAGGEAVLRSAFAPDESLREEIERAARSVIGGQTPLRFETKPSLGAGLELTVNGRKTSWTIDNYLGSLKTSLRELMERNTAADDEKS